MPSVVEREGNGEILGGNLGNRKIPALRCDGRHASGASALIRSFTEIIQSDKSGGMAGGETMYVIFAGPLQQDGPGTHYIAKDGTTTTSKVHAAKFYLRIDAVEFARKKEIPLNDHTYIDLENFSEFEVRGD
jgi:hypothetical protein